MTTDANLPEDDQELSPEPPDQHAEPSAVSAGTSGSAENTAETAGAKPTELEAELAREREAAADYLRRWQQAQADLANYRRRAQQEQEQHVRLATGRALALVLPAVDSFERAFATLPPSLRGYSWMSGLALVEMQLQSALTASGAAEVPAEPGAAFNPQHHEAVGEVETAEHPEGHIAVVLQRGYAIEGLLIRPALVQLARVPQSSPVAGAASEAPAPEPSALADSTDEDREGDGETEA